MQNTKSRTDHSHRDRITILIPVFDDWGSLARLLPEIDAVMGSASLQGHVTVIDDKSTVAAPNEIRHQSYFHLSPLEIIRLTSNLGHQRAIAVGLAHLSKLGVRPEPIVIMDGDGEDRPEDIPSLVAELSGNNATWFSQRERSGRKVSRFA